MDNALLRAMWFGGGWHRKPTSWGVVGEPIPLSTLACCQVYSSVDLGVHRNITSDLKRVPEDHIFLITHGEGLYLANTEGYSYLRFVRYIGRSKELLAALEVEGIG